MNDMKPIKLLITGGAGFIGSNLVEHFLKDERVALVRVLDDLSNGYFENINEFVEDPKFEFIQGDICDYQTCLKACEDIDKISHQAALGSVPRSIENPIRTNEVNVGGTLNMLYAAKEQGVGRIILAFSSSTYGDHSGLPKIEDRVGKPLSPYAVSKAAIEQYADVFGKTYGLEWIGFRYFNIFGPKQSPTNPYAAVIPIFCRAFLENKALNVNGDGKTSRDFTFIENVIHAHDLALFKAPEKSLNTIYNLACGKQTSLNDIISKLSKLTRRVIEPSYGPERPGDVKHSKADISKLQNLLGYSVQVNFDKGLEQVYKWYKNNL